MTPPRRYMNVWAASLLLAAGAVAAAPTRPAATAGKRSASPSPDAPPAHRRGREPKADPLRYKPATPAQVAAYRRIAMGWFELARKDVAPAMHMTETEHFLIFSAWPRSDDRPMGIAAEKLYDALCSQFSVPRSENIFAGKCPIYTLATKEQFTKFTEVVDKSKFSKAAGYHCQRSDGFCYLVLSQVNSKQWFYELLTHEGTHAFVGRYLTNRFLPTWVNEGLAETMAATLVPGSQAGRKYVQATAEVLRKRLDVSHVFEKVEMNNVDYGVAQSLVRYLIARDRKGFIEFFRLLKEGKTDEEALKEVYDLTREQLLDAWRKAAAKALSRQ